MNPSLKSGLIVAGFLGLYFLMCYFYDKHCFKDANVLLDPADPSTSLIRPEPTHPAADPSNDFVRFPVMAPTVDQVKRMIANTEYLYHQRKAVVCILTLKNGSKVIGESYCADVRSYSRIAGEQVAYQKAKAKIFEFVAFLNHEDAYREFLAGIGTDAVSLITRNQNSYLV